MKKMILTVATLLAISGSALAGSDNYGSNSSNQPAVSIDNTDTGSTSKPTEPATATPASQGADRNLFGS